VKKYSNPAGDKHNLFRERNDEIWSKGDKKSDRTKLSKPV